MKLVNQIDDKTCTSACIAMITGEPIEEVISKFHKDYFTGRQRVSDYLRRKGLFARDMTSTERYMAFNAIYILCVPSLNQQASFHSIVADTRDTVEIHDPQKGREGKKYYTYKKSDDPLAVTMKGYIIDTEIINWSK